MPVPLPDPPSDLTIPERGSQTSRAILSLAIRALFEDLKAMRAPAGLGDEGRRAWRAVREVLSGLLPGRPGAVASLLRKPTVSAPLRCLRSQAGDADANAVEVAAQSLFALALGGFLDAEVELTRAPPRLISLDDRVAVEVPPGTRRATFGPRSLAFDGRPVDLDDPALGEPFAEVVPGIVLSRVDNNPLSMFEAHPDKAGNAIALGGRPSDEWVRSLADAFALVAEHTPALRDEMDLHLHQIVPVGYDDHSHLSASYQEALGTVYMTLHPQPMTMAEALIHEFSHNKVNALFELDPVLHNAYSPLFTSPVRPDPRPLHGVLLAVHAFQPVARLYEHMIDHGHPWASRPDFLRRYRQILQKNHEGATVILENGDPTPIGQGLLDEIRRWDDHFRPQLSE